MGKLTKKNEVFCDEYLIDLNATQAAIRAGYSVESAGSIGSELLKKPEIRARIDRAMAERSKRTGINADRVLLELGKIAFVNAIDVINMTDATVLTDAFPRRHGRDRFREGESDPRRRRRRRGTGSPPGGQVEGPGTVRKAPGNVQGQPGQHRPCDGGDQL